MIEGEFISPLSDWEPDIIQQGQLEREALVKKVNDENPVVLQPSVEQSLRLESVRIVAARIGAPIAIEHIIAEARKVFDFIIEAN